MCVLYARIQGEDDNAPPPSLPLVIDVGDRDRDDVGNESSRGMIKNDELYEILSWLPAKSVIKYSSSLCKCLSNIYSEPGFTEKQCIHSSGQNNGFLLQCIGNSHITHKQPPNKIEFYVLPWETRSAFGISRQSLDYLPKHGRILSSSNGLLLLGLQTHEDIEFKICNPATRKWAPLDTPKGFNFLVNEIDFTPLFECYPRCVEFPDDYTIAFPVQVNPLIEKTQLLIYSNGRWDDELCDVNIEGRFVSYEMPVAIFSDKGLVVHYICHSEDSIHLPFWQGGYVPRVDSVYVEPYIAAFNIREKKLIRIIKLPEGAWDVGQNISSWSGSRRSLWIYKWNDTSICFVRWELYFGPIAVWLLENYGCEEESWRMVMDTNIEHLSGDSGTPYVIDGEVEYPLGLNVDSSKGVLMIATTERVFACALEGEHQGMLKFVGDHSLGPNWNLAIKPYANTLRPVSIQNSETFTY